MLTNSIDNFNKCPVGRVFLKEQDESDQIKIDPENGAFSKVAERSNSDNSLEMGLLAIMTPPVTTKLLVFRATTVVGL